MAPRETENNVYAKFWSDQQRVLWHVMVFSGVVNYNWLTAGKESGSILSSRLWGGALRDDTKNGCVADYLTRGLV